jgi:hypothetical protein
MSLPETPGPPEPEPRRRPDFGSALLILVGVGLLLPGLCAVISAINIAPMMWRDPTAIVPLGLLWAFCLLVSYGGLRLIARSSRGSRG